MILSRMDKDGKTSEMEVKPEEGEFTEYHAFAESIMSAIKDSSVADLAKALEEFHEMIKEEDVEQDLGE